LVVMKVEKSVVGLESLWAARKDEMVYWKVDLTVRMMVVSLVGSMVDDLVDQKVCAKVSLRVEELVGE